LFVLPESLKSIFDCIVESKILLSDKYCDDYDDDGAKSTDIITYVNAIWFLRFYALTIFSKYGKVIETPDIDLLKEGGIVIEWCSLNRKDYFYITFNKGSEIGSYYGKFNNVSYKGNIMLNIYKTDNEVENIMINILTI
jgi:hypothetical protein